MTILLVDDDPADARLVREILTRQDSDLTIIDAHTCNEALSLADMAQIDCIVMDEALKGMPGSECVKLVRDQKYRGAFGLITGHPDTRQAVDAMLTGCDFYLSKDDVRDGLLSAISKAVERRRDAVRSQEAADTKEQQYKEDLQQLREQRQTAADFGPGWIETQRDIRNITNSLATLNAEVAAVKGATAQQFDMLLKMQQANDDMKKAADKSRNDRWKMFWAFLTVLVIQAAGVFAVIYGNGKH